jgi:hypothetical protein
LRVLIVASVLFTVIQTQMPAFSVNKTMPGCVKSFTGYPLSGEEDTSGLKYFACILNKMKASYEPWDAITENDCRYDYRTNEKNNIRSGSQTS